MHHLCFVVAFWNGSRISETLELTGKDVFDGKIRIKRKKGSLTTCHPIHIDIDPIFDASPVLQLAMRCGDNKLFPISRQRMDQLIKKYGLLAGIHESKLHMHSLKHSISMLLWHETKDLGQLQNFLGHKSQSSSLIYLREIDATKAQQAVANIRL
jgi:integrase